MKAVLMSIQPKWCELIAKGEKEIDLRKTAPALKTPFKCYIYMSQGKLKDLGTYSDWFYQNRMKVIGEFVCDRIEEIPCYIEASEYNEYLVSDQYLQNCKLSYTELYDYLNGKDGYGWNISKLKIYDEPKELSEFEKACNKNANCAYCKQAEFNGGNCNGRITRPPQSWCYVEEL